MDRNDLWADTAFVLCTDHGHYLGDRAEDIWGKPLVTGEADAVREWALAGYWSREVHVVDGHRKYARTTTTNGFPMSMWSNRWSTMPIEGLPQLRLPRPDRRATLDFRPGSDVPVIRQPFREGDLLPYWGAGPRRETHLLFDLDVDPDETESLAGTSREREAEELLRAALQEVGAPDDQLARLGLA